MKIIYFATRNFCHTTGWTEFNLDSDWSFKLADKDGVITLSCMHQNILPTHMFAKRTGELSPPVEQISAIIGANGTGKTSFANALSLAFRYKVEHDLDFLYDSSSQIDFVAIVSTKEPEKGSPGVLQCFSNLNIELEDTAMSAVIDAGYEITASDSELSNIGSLIYHSPIFTYWSPINADDATVVDLSTTRYSDIKMEEIESQDATGCQLTGRERAYLEEQLRILRFLAVLETKKRESSVEIDLPKPRSIYCYGVNESLDHLNRYAHEWEAFNEKDKITWLLNSNDIFAKALITFILDSVANAVPHELADWNFANADVKARVLDLIGDLACAVFHANETTAHEDALLDYAQEITTPDINAYRTAVDALKRIAHDIENSQISQDNLFGNDRNEANLLAGIELFDKMVQWMEAYPSSYQAGSLEIDLSSPDALKVVGEMIDAHARCKAGWSIRYIDFGFGLSAGEMSVLALFGRLFDHLIESFADESAHLVLFLDESETTLHPQLQRNLVSYLIEFFEVFFPQIRAHIMFATHSPIVLSDIPKGNCVFFGCEGDELRDMQNTFGANIFDLYRLPFVLTNGTTGTFAQNKIDALIEKIFLRVSKEGLDNGGLVINEQDKAVAKLVGDERVKRYLQGWIDTFSEK